MSVLVLHNSLTPTYTFRETLKMFYKTKIMITDEIQQLFSWITTEEVDLLIVDIQQGNALNVLTFVPLMKKANSKMLILLYGKGLTEEGKSRIEKDFGINLILDYTDDAAKLIQISKNILFDRNYKKDFSNDNVRV